MNISIRNTAVPLVALLGISAVSAAAQTESQLPSSTQLDPLLVVGEQAGEDYRSDDARELGPLGRMTLKETPYSINVVTRELLDNAQAHTADDALRLSPVVQLISPQTRFFTSVNLRGFSTGTRKRVAGLPNANWVTVDMEDKERIEILTGLSGFLYGVGNVGGTLNYVLKRPTPERFNRVRVANTGGENGMAHGDFGGPIDEQGRFGYRVNVAAQGGDTIYDEQSIERTFASGAFDWRVSERLLLQIDASRSDYEMRGTEPYWATRSVEYPDAPDAGQFYGQPFSYTQTQQDHAGLRADWAISEVFNLRAAYAYRSSEMTLQAANNTLVTDDGDYEVRTSTFIYPDESNHAAYVFLDTRLTTGPLAHELTLGYYGQRCEGGNFRTAQDPDGMVWTTYTGFNLNRPTYVGKPVYGPYTPRYTAQRSTHGNFVLGDHLRFGERWSALAGVNYATIRDRGYGADGSPTSDYDEGRLSPTVAVLYAPAPALSLYANYMESFEQGGVAAATYNDQPVANAGKIMEPLISRQYEIGAKAEVGGMWLTAALFRIDRGLQYYDVSIPTSPVFVQDGRQVHDGIELTATGAVSERLTLVGGLTALDPRIEKNREAPEIEGNVPQNVAELYAKLYAEYGLSYPTGLWLTGAVCYTGSQQTSLNNDDTLPSFTTADLGLRFQTDAIGKPLVLRLNITNLTDEDYWLSSFYLGRPRTLVFSAQLDF